MGVSDTVFILGAGASAECGAPVMANFLDTARRLHREGRTGDKGTYFSDVFDGITALSAVYEKSNLDTDNLESVFAAFEMARLFGGLKNLDADLLGRLPDALRFLIVETLEQTIQFPVTQKKVSGPIFVEAPHPYANAF
jgi:hypothetical protein